MESEEQYWMLGGDGREYGPVALPTLQTWVDEGRVAPETRVRTGVRADWVPAGTVAGLIWPPGRLPEAAVGNAGVAPELSADRVGALVMVRSRASWFFWIAALSAVNLVLQFTGAGIGFAVSTTVTDLVGALAVRMESGGLAIALVADAVILGVICCFGWLARRGSVVAFAVGLVLYAIDGVLALVFEQWISAAFHAYVVWELFKGLQGARRLRRTGST